METKLEHLIEKIKSDGIEEARKSSQDILNQSRVEADKILKKARDEAERIKSDASQEAQRIRESGEAALKQASRDTILVTKEKLTSLLDAVFKQEIGAVMSPETLRELIVKMAEAFEGRELEALVGPADVSGLKNLILAKNRDRLNAPVIIKVDKGISRGLRIGIKDGDVHYDFSDESIAAFLGEFLNPAIRKLLK